MFEGRVCQPVIVCPKLPGNPTLQEGGGINVRSTVEVGVVCGSHRHSKHSLMTAAWVGVDIYVFLTGILCHNKLGKQ